MNEPGPSSCEVCGASPLVKVLFPVAVHYKGSGFYSTDYGRGKRKGKDSGGDSSSSDGGGSSDSSGSSDGGSSGSTDSSPSTTSSD